MSKSRSAILGVLVNYAIARVVPHIAVPRLVSALSSADEDRSMGGFMILVKLGPRIASHQLNEARAGRETVNILQVLGGQGDPSIIPELEKFAQSTDSAVASAAGDSLAALCSQEQDDSAS